MPYAPPVHKCGSEEWAFDPILEAQSWTLCVAVRWGNLFHEFYQKGDLIRQILLINNKTNQRFLIPDRTSCFKIIMFLTF